MALIDIKNFLNYTKDVLGIKQILTSKETGAGCPRRLVVSVSELSSYNADEKGLLEKMIMALQLGNISYCIQDSQDSRIPADYYLILADQAPLSSENSENSVTTFSPRKLLQEPHLKKAAWSEMQNLLQKIKSF